MPATLSIINTIENLVLERKALEAKKEIKKVEKELRQSSHGQMMLAHWYRRLTLFEEALKIFRHIPLESIKAKDPFRSEKILMARLFNLLGNSYYALNLLTELGPELLKQSEDLITLGNILVSNYQYQQALPYIQKALFLYENENNHLLKILHADCLSGLSQNKDALEIALKVFEKCQSESPQLKFIILSAAGEYALKDGQYDKSHQLLQQASQYRNPLDLTHDSGFWNKWMGLASFLSKGDKPSALNHLQKAMNILGKPKSKPEMWMEVLYWQGLIKNQVSKDFPLEWYPVLVYPSSYFPYRQKIPTDLSVMNNIIQIHLSPLSFSSIPLKDLDINSKPRSSSWSIDSYSDYQIQEPDQVKIGLDKRHQFLLYHARSLPYGITKLRMIEMLWKEELNSWDSLESRFKNLLHQLKKWDIEVSILKGVLNVFYHGRKPTFFLHPQENKNAIAGAFFLEKNRNKSFCLQDVSKQLKVRKTRSSEIISSWKSLNIITKDNTLSGTYRVNENFEPFCSSNL